MKEKTKKKVIQHIGFDDEEKDTREYYRYIRKTIAEELIDRMEKGLYGDEAIKHYNDWMKEAKLKELII